MNAEGLDFSCTVHINHLHLTLDADTALQFPSKLLALEFRQGGSLKIFKNRLVKSVIKPCFD
jgi:hypothetical protein